MTTNPSAIAESELQVYSRQYVYDFNIDGGAIGTINMRSLLGALPATARVITARWRTARDFVSLAGNATAIGIEATNDLQAAADCNQFSLGDVTITALGAATPSALNGGNIALYAAGNVGGEIPLTQPRIPRLTVGVHPITDGAGICTVMYVKD